MNWQHLASIAGLGLALIAGPSSAQTGKPAIEVQQPWTRATGAGQAVGGGFLTLQNKGAAADRLLGASTPAAERVELHSMKMEGEVMRMRQVDAIDVPAGETVELKPGGLHLMLMGLKQPLKAGATMPVTLRFEKAGDLPVVLQIDAAGATAPSHRHGSAEHKH